MTNKPLGVIVLLLIGLGTGMVAADFVGPTQSQTPANQQLDNVDTTQYADGNAYTNLYNEVVGSVVSIRVGGSSARATQGSGFVYDFNGHIVTNQHVVTSADSVDVRFSRGDWREGDVIGTDVYTDLAVIEVNSVPEYAEPLPIADQDPPQGTPVAAIGNPLGLEGSITQGIVSGLNRSMQTEGDFTIPDTVQTDAGIDRGNSGGPLVDLDGNVVGVNRARQGTTIGFAVSPALIERVVPQLVHQGSVEHAYMGIASLDVSPRVAEANDLDEPRGIMVARVVDGTPSEDVFQGSEEEVEVRGVQVPVGGDIITHINGEKINTHEELSRYLMIETRPNEEIEVTIIRDGEEQTVTMTLGTRPDPSDL